MDKKKSRRHIIIPLLLLVYLVFMAYFTYPGTDNPELSLTQYCITIGITLVVIVAAFFFIRKKEENKQKYKDDK